MLKFVKDARRRSVETILESVGAAEKTVDPEYDLYTKNFTDMMEDMNECGACITSTLLKQKEFFEEAVELSESLVRIYQKNENPERWPSDVPQMLTLGSAAVNYRDALKEIHTSYRSSMAKCCSEISLQPIRSAVTAMGPEIERETAECAKMVKDYDSYQRRLKTFKSKLDNATDKGKDEASAEVDKFELKVATAKANYEAQNSKVKTEIISAKRAFDAMVEMELVTMLVSQHALFEHSANIMAGLLNQLPQDKVNQVNKRLTEYIKQGGVQVKVEEKTQAEKVLDVALGKAKKGTLKEKTSEQIQQAELEKQSELQKAKEIVEKNDKEIVPVTSTVTNHNPFVTQSTSNNNAKVAPPPPPPPPPPPCAPTPSNKKLVEALYDHNAEETDELSFKVGEQIEVLDDSDSGWWEGKNCATGKKGIFPVNYVKEL